MSLLVLSARIRRAALAALLLPGLALASVGKIAVLEGKATRTPKGGAAVPLAVGAEVEVDDTVDVAKGGNVKLVLSDDSVLMVGGDSQLVLERARFDSLEHRDFSFKLSFGKAWAKVTHALAGSDAKFEVTTQRAVAGVRGTIFRIDTARLLGAVNPKIAHTTVSVVLGKVAVEAKVKAIVPKAAPAAAAPAKKGERRLVAGPQEVSKEEWEKRFVELQGRQQIQIGEELWKEAAYVPEKENDAFALFIRLNDKQG